MTDLEPAVPECLSCGTCCFSELREYVRVTGDDYARMGERAADLTDFDGHDAYMKMDGGHCAALQIVLATGRFECSAYDVRPRTCRELERGSSACGGERATKAERPLLALKRRTTR